MKKTIQANAIPVHSDWIISNQLAEAPLGGRDLIAWRAGFILRLGTENIYIQRGENGSGAGWIAENKIAIEFSISLDIYMHVFPTYTDTDC